MINPSIKKWLRKDISAAMMFLAPSGIGFAMFYLIPFVMGVFYSFMDSTIEGHFVGFDNYRELLKSDSFRKAASNTFYFSAISVPLILVLSLGLAMLLNKNTYFRNWLRTGYVLPLVVPVVSIILIWQILFDWNGSLNAWLNNFGIERVDWMKTDAARNVIIVVYLWKNIGYNVILFLAGLQQIPKDYYETAQIEGAGSLRQFRSITLVYLTSSMFFVVIMSIINSFKVFRETYLIAGDYPHDSIYILQHYMNNMFMTLDVQKLTAAATLMFGCILLIVLGLFAFERRHRQFME
ncbi:multiple sugar transport system permease protein [Paenibacillus sp. PastF-3]|uniref:carbohydrate ABC transporter permease n=1 Tax=unclassified Paenibacillus TaxID=185978 RepID=UPI0015C5CE45|nr:MULTISPECIES: sugar ABC transporter permease [unclassified Paenibacillus]MDH6368681.1 multiple sugar transport system permease protein [Paenibacillus sp. PastF-3]